MPTEDETNEVCDLADRHCVPCRGGVPPFDAATIATHLTELGGGWACVDDHHLAKVFQFHDFMSGLDFVTRAAEIAEAEGHHPDLTLSWGKVTANIWTHKIDGVVEADFILAAKLDVIYEAD